MSTLVCWLSLRLGLANFMAAWALEGRDGRIRQGHRPTCKAFYNLIFICGSVECRGPVRLSSHSKWVLLSIIIDYSAGPAWQP